MENEGVDYLGVLCGNYETVIKRYSIDLQLNTGADIEKISEYCPELVVIAISPKPIQVQVPGAEKGHLAIYKLLDDAKGLSKKVCVIGVSGRMYITQFMGKDAALKSVPGFEDDFESSLHFLHELILEPGARIGEHKHVGSEEIYFLVEGTGEITVDGETQIMSEGDAVLTRNGSSHSFIVSGSQPVKLYVVEAGVE